MRGLFVISWLILVAYAIDENSGSLVAGYAKGLVDKYTYSWGGGNCNGPSYGVKMTSKPFCDDRKVKGFDSAGLTMYSVYKGCGKSLPHYAQTQFSECSNKIPVEDKKPGDLLFYGASISEISHVAVYVGNNDMVEAPGHDANCNGLSIRRCSVRSNLLIGEACRYW